MGLIDKILGGLPENSLLRAQNRDLTDKNAALETEVAILKDEKREAAAKITKLKKQIDDLAHIELDAIDTQILLYIANAIYSAPWAEVIAEQLNIHTQVAQFRLDRLENAYYIYGSRDFETGAQVYEMADKGRAFLIEKNLIN